MRCRKEVLQLFALTDHLMLRLKGKSRLMGRPVTCQGPGCSACCLEPVYVDFLEVDHALGRVTSALRKRVKARTGEWLAKVEPSGLLAQALPDVFAWRALQAPCPFLEEGQCAIYDDRPVACRQHCAVGPPSACADEQQRRRQQFLSSPEVDDALARSLKKNARLANMGVWLAKILLGREIQPTPRLDFPTVSFTLRAPGERPPSSPQENLNFFCLQRLKNW